MSYPLLLPNPVFSHGFDRLRAEQEDTWLEQVFVEPPGFDNLAGMRSVVVFGESGSGKTALRLALSRRAHRGNAPDQLVIDWRPTLAVGLSGSPAIRAFLVQALEDCALALLQLLGSYPHMFTSAPQWAQETIRWFIHYNLALPDDYDLHLSKLQETATPPGLDLLQDVLVRTPRPILDRDAPETKIIARLATAMQRLGLSGVWICIDGLEPLIEADDAELAPTLKAILSTLALFEEPGFALKIMAPISIESALASSGSLTRQRVDVYHLQWPPDRLVAIVERRLAALTGKQPFHLADLCIDDELMGWLTRYGGNIPRGWLELTRPLAEAYMSAGANQPLSAARWNELRQQYPPRLWVDLTTDQVFIGYGEVSDLQPGAYKLLRHLYERRPHRCSRSELYYRGYRNLDHEPQSHQDPGWEAPQEWDSALDTMLWRLRRAVEPDIKHPIYLIVERGRGVRLEHTR